MQRISGIRIGETKRIRVVVKLEGRIIDITSDTVTLLVKTNETDLDSAAIIDQDADVSSNGVEGIADITVPTSTTDNLTEGKKYYEIFIDRSSGERFILSQGVVYVSGRLGGVT